MLVQTKEACQEIFAPAKIFTIERKVGGITLADMEAIFGRLTRADAVTGGIQHTVMLESENQERTRVFNFTEIPITKIGQDGARHVILPADVSGYMAVFTPQSVQGLQTPGWWSALAKTQTKPHDLLDKIVVARSRFFIGNSLVDIKGQLRSSRLSDESFEKLITSTPITAYFGGKRIQAIYAMFMYVIDKADFKGYLHLHERSSDTFVSFYDPILAPSHPWDVCNAVVDCRAVDEPGIRKGLPVLTYRLVYHDHPPRPRYLKEGSTVVELIPEKDLTTQEGFYKHFFMPDRPNGTPGFHDQSFVPLEKITEDNGFYLSRESAVEDRVLQEIIAQQKQRQIDNEQTVKAWIAAVQADAKASQVHYKEFYAECLNTKREAMRKQANEYEQWTNTIAKERDALRAQVDQLKIETVASNRVHEEAMQERKEILEALKLIPAVLAVVGAFIAIGQKGKKK